jgi:DnaJ family protein B protein 12
MESNKDEALRCLAIAQRYRDAGSIQSARKFCEKSINLFSTPAALKLLATINATASSQGTSSATDSTSASAHQSSSGVKQRRGAANTNGGTASGIGGEKRDYTPEQKEVVRRVRACKVTEYYEILEVKKDCEDADVKKAYRKVRVVVCVVQPLPGLILCLAGPCFASGQERRTWC